MKRTLTLLLMAVILALSARGGFCNLFKTSAKPMEAVLCPKGASAQEILAAHEIRRYIYLRTNHLLPIVECDAQTTATANAILAAAKGNALVQRIAADDKKLAEALGALGEQQYLIKTTKYQGEPILLIAGGDAAGTLYGTYRFAERLGVRFYLHGDVTPETKIAPNLPELDEQAKPLFNLRGIQPFHDFPEGPDWWSTDDYKAIIGQLPKLRMNFFGLHTYPESKPHAEPTVWIGMAEDFGPGDRVKHSYPTAYFNTARTDWAGFNWGYETVKTSDFPFGASQLFESDIYGPDVMKGHLPYPKTEEGCNEVFNRTSEMLRQAFNQAHALGVKTCVGTEIPLMVPGKVGERLSQGPDYVGPLGGRTVTYATSAIEGTEDAPIYNSVRYDFKGYVLPVPNGTYRVTLKFCEVSHNNPNGRVFDVSLQGKKVLDKLDIWVKAGGKNKALDCTFENVAVEDGKMRIGLTPVQEFPAMAGIEIAGKDNYSQKVNCGGAAYKDYLADDGNQLFMDESVKKLYAGMFKRIMAAYPIDFYWFWTGEGWTWQDASAGEVQSAAKDLQIAVAAAKETGVPFKLATCGWVLGPSGDRGMFDRDLPKDVALSCINRQVGHAPVDTSFARIQGRPLWAIPWLEDDPTLTSVQLWAGRMRRDAADALAYGCNGLLGIHWRTKIMGPNVAALAQAGWDQTGFNPYPTPFEGPLGGKALVFPDQRISNTDQPEVYRSMRVGLTGYRLRVPNGTYKVTLKFCELLNESRDGRYISARVQGNAAADSLDVYSLSGPARAFDYVVDKVGVQDGWLNIDLSASKGETMLSALTIEGPGYTRKINCGGPAVADYEADLKTPSRHLQADDFYQDWATNQFGEEVGTQAAAIFARVDGALPLTSLWINGPGGYVHETRAWDQVKEDYAFVGQLEALRPAIKGAGNLERFDYWLNNFRAMESAHHLRCVWFHFNLAMEQIKAAPNDEARKKIARETALPLRKEMIGLLGQMYGQMLATVSTPGEMGTVTNWSEHTLPSMITRPGEELAKALGEPLPADAQPSLAYSGQARLIVPTVRGSLAAGEDLNLKVQILSAKAPAGAALYWRKLGGGEFAEIPLKHVARGVYTVQIPASEIGGQDFEYYLKANVDGEAAVQYPATAPQLNQTVIVPQSQQTI